MPDLTGVRLRSVPLDGWGSTLTLRLDLLRFPDRWGGGPGDTTQCQIAFPHVEDFVMEGWRPPVTADRTRSPQGWTAGYPTVPPTYVNTFYERV